MPYNVPLLARFLAKLVLDILPAALASVIGGFLFTHYQLGRAPQPTAAAQVAPASAEMMQLVRDEHALIVNFLKAQMVAEKTKLTAEDEAPRAAVEAELARAAAGPRQAVVAMVAPKPVALHSKTPVVGASLPPLVIAQNETVKPAAANPDSLVAKTIGIKDHVLSVTQRVVSVIGGIPSWIGSIGDHIGGEGETPRPPANLVSAS
ncbi:MAG: hypothetical protein ABSD08_17160 [Xanthobacteraceae bacterium]|jgi:hypothetical protein